MSKSRAHRNSSSHQSELQGDVKLRTMSFEDNMREASLDELELELETVDFNIEHYNAIFRSGLAKMGFRRRRIYLQRLIDAYPKTRITKRESDLH
jgi:hypothetical protein